MSGPDEAAVALGRTRLFGELSADERRMVAADGKIHDYGRGQVVFHSGDAGDSLLVVCRGRLKVVVRSADGGELMLAVLTPGDVAGELGVVDGGARSADAETLEPSQVLLIPRATVLAAARRHDSVSVNLLLSIATTLRRLTETAADLVFLDLPRRVAKVILEAPRSADQVVDLGLNQEELAHLVGGTRQSVNAALRGFERRRWISLIERRVVVHDEDALERFSK